MGTKKHLIRIMIGLVLVFIGSIVIMQLLSIVEAATFTVDDDGNAEYTKIQDAIDNATEGDTIRVWEGTYYENVVVNKTVSLVGNGSEETTIDGGENEYVVRVEAEESEISSLRIIRGYYGIYLATSHSNKISNNTIENNTRGLSGSSSSSFFTNNTIQKNQGYGIYIVGDNNELSKNVVKNHPGHAMSIYGGPTIITNNTVLNNGAYGIELIGDSSLISRNCVSNNRFGIRSAGDSNTVKKNVITGNNLTGISLGGSYSNITENLINNTTRDGISIGGSYNTISENTIENNMINGIYVSSGSYTDIMNNTIRANSESGLYLIYSDSNNIEENSIVDNKEGIHLEARSDANIAKNNEIAGNTQYGINANIYQYNVINAEDNWWGNSSGPFHPDKNPNGKGNEVTDKVEFNPWIGKPYLVHNINSNTSYRSIQKALDDAAKGDTIRVWKGSFYERIRLNLPVQLIGNGSSDTIIHGDGSRESIFISADDCQIGEFNISNNSDIGIYFYYSSSCTISNNTIRSNRDYGIYLKRSSSNTITNNSIDDNYDVGIFFDEESNSNTATFNSITHSKSGITLEGSSQENVIRDNSIFRHYYYGISASDNNEYTVNASNNWWGANSGPYHPEMNSNGQGDEVTDYVEFDPWQMRKQVFNVDKDEYYYYIQEAIDDATTGDTIRLFETNFNENIIINKTLNLIGNGSDLTEIHSPGPEDPEGAYFFPGIIINADDVTLSGLKISGVGFQTGSDPEYIIWGVGVAVVGNDTSITDSVFTNHVTGIFAGALDLDVNTGTFTHNTGGEGLAISNCSFNNIVPDPPFNNFHTGQAIVLHNMEDSSIVDNHFDDCGMEIRGDEVRHFIHTIDNNTIDDGNLIYIKEIDSQAPEIENAKQIIVADSNSFEITDCDLPYGFTIAFSHGITIRNSRFEPSKTAVSVYYSSNIHIISNQIFDSPTHAMIIMHSSHVRIVNNEFNASAGNTAIFFSDSSNNTIQANQFINWYEVAISLSYGSSDNLVESNRFNNCVVSIDNSESYGNRISNNTISDGEDGIVIYDANRTRIDNNSISECSDAGIYAAGECSGTVIEWNLIFSNDDGILLNGVNGITVIYSVCFKMLFFWKYCEHCTRCPL